MARRNLKRVPSDRYCRTCGELEADASRWVIPKLYTGNRVCCRSCHERLKAHGRCSVDGCESRKAELGIRFKSVLCGQHLEAMYPDPCTSCGELKPGRQRFGDVCFDCLTGCVWEDARYVPMSKTSVPEWYDLTDEDEQLTAVMMGANKKCVRCEKPTKRLFAGHSLCRQCWHELGRPNEFL